MNRTTMCAKNWFATQSSNRNKEKWEKKHGKLKQLIPLDIANGCCFLLLFSAETILFGSLNLNIHDSWFAHWFAIDSLTSVCIHYTSRRFDTNAMCICWFQYAACISLWMCMCVQNLSCSVARVLSNGNQC